MFNISSLLYIFFLADLSSTLFSLLYVLSSLSLGTSSRILSCLLQAGGILDPTAMKVGDMGTSQGMTNALKLAGTPGPKAKTKKRRAAEATGSGNDGDGQGEQGQQAASQGTADV